MDIKRLLSGIGEKKLQETALIENFVEYYENETGEKLKFLEWPDKNHRNEKRSDISFIIESSGKRLNVELTRVFQSTQHVKKTIEWSKFLNEVKRELKGKLSGYFTIIILKPEGKLTKKYRTTLLREMSNAVIKKASQMAPGEECDCLEPMVFKIKKTLNDRDKGVNFLFGLENLTIDAEAVRYLIEPSVVDANQKFKYTPNDITVLLFQDRTELNLLDVSTEVTKEFVETAINSIPISKRQYISCYYVLEGVEVLKIY